MLLTEEVLLPEGVVGFEEVVSLVAIVAMHAVRVDHEVELLAFAVEGIKELEGVLVMDVVVTGAVGQFQHDWLNRLPRR